MKGVKEKVPGHTPESISNFTAWQSLGEHVNGAAKRPIHLVSFDGCLRLLKFIVVLGETEMAAESHVSKFHASMDPFNCMAHMAAPFLLDFPQEDKKTEDLPFYPPGIPRSHFPTRTPTNPHTETLPLTDTGPMISSSEPTVQFAILPSREVVP